MLFAALVISAIAAAQLLAGASAAPASALRGGRSAARTPGAAPAAETFIAASDPAVTFVGRTLINADGSRSFDWEGTQMLVNVQGASYVKVVASATGGILGRFVVEAGGVAVSSFYVGGGNGATTYLNNTYFAAYDLSGLTAIRVISVLEPAFEGAAPGAYLTFVGFLTDGTAAPASPPRARRIELVGDSISAGYGSRGSAHLAKNFGCPVNDNTSGNYCTSRPPPRPANFTLAPNPCVNRGPRALKPQNQGLTTGRSRRRSWQTLFRSRGPERACM